MIKTNQEDLFQAMLKNLPQRIHCSNTKSGAYSKAPVPTHIALKNFQFIEFNSKDRITIAVFDKDEHNNQTALEYFKDIILFQEWLIEMINIVPSYICQTTKGFQFGFIIKGFMTIKDGFKPKNSPQQFLNDIKEKYIKYLELDSIASSRNNGIFRNPIKHIYLAYPTKVYNLNDLNNALDEVVFDKDIISYSKKDYLKVSKSQKILSHRNSSIFKLCCKEFAYSKPILKQIFSFANSININNCYKPLPSTEIKSISKSIYKRCQNNTLKSGSKKAQLNRSKLVKDRKKQIIKYFLKYKRDNKKVIKSKLAKELGITVQSLNKTYGDFIKLKYKI